MAAAPATFSPPALTREQALAGLQQAERATEGLKQLLRYAHGSPPDLARIQQHLAAGAMTSRLDNHWSHLLFEKDHREAMKALLTGCELMPHKERAQLLLDAVARGTPEMVSIVLASPAANTLPETLYDALVVAIGRDQVGMVQQLLTIGAPLVAPNPETMRYRGRLGEHLFSVEMLDALVAGGYAPTSSDAHSSALIGSGAYPSPPGHFNEPNPALLQRFVELGALATEDGRPGRPWCVLLREPAKQVAYREAQVACARILIDAGMEMDAQNLSLPAIAVLLAAGLSADTITPIVKKANRWSSLSGELVFAFNDDRKKHMSEWIEATRELLLEVDRGGIAMETLLPLAEGSSWLATFASAGCEMDESKLMSVDKKYLQQREQSILRRNTAPAIGRPRAPRL